MDDADNTAWDRAWSAMPRRRILDTSKVDFVKHSGLDLGEVVSVTANEVPEDYSENLYIAIPVCPVCGQSTEEYPDRIVVHVSPVFTRIPNLGFGAWAHRTCLERCPLIDGPSPIPW